MDDTSARVALTRAAVHGIFAGLALLACTPPRGTSVTAPMESATPGAAPGAVTATPALPVAVVEDPLPKDCCKGKNACKGLSGCESAQNDCRGKNECKGWGTSCDSSEESMLPATKQATPRSRTANCCSGKNQCKGKSGCRSAHNPGGAGANDCKGKGTSCPRRP